MSDISFDRRYLAPLERRHLPLLKRWRNAQMNVLRQFVPLTDADQRRWFSEQRQNPRQVLFMLMLRNGARRACIGYCGITNIDFKNRRGEISFLVEPHRAAHPAVYRRDFRAGLALLCRYGFEELNLHRLFTDTFDFRALHVGVLEQFGLRKEGTLRQHYFGRGTYFDSLIHALLASEWQRVRKNLSYDY